MTNNEKQKVLSPVDLRKQKNAEKKKLNDELKKSFTANENFYEPTIEGTKHASLKKESFDSIVKGYKKGYKSFAKNTLEIVKNGSFKSPEAIIKFKVKLKKDLIARAKKIKVHADKLIKEGFLKQQHEEFKKKIENVAKTSKQTILNQIYDETVYSKKELDNIDKSDLNNLISIYVNKWKNVNLNLDIDEKSAYAVDNIITSFDQTHFSKDLDIAINIIEAIADQWAKGSAKINRQIFSASNWHEVNDLPDFPGGAKNKIKQKIKNKYDKDGVWLNEEGRKFAYESYNLDEYSVDEFSDMVGENVKFTKIEKKIKSQKPKSKLTSKAEAAAFKHFMGESVIVPLGSDIGANEKQKPEFKIKNQIVKLEKECKTKGINKKHIEDLIPKVLTPEAFLVAYRDSLQKNLNILKNTQINLETGTVTVNGKVIKLDTDSGIQFSSGQKNIKKLPTAKELKSTITASKIKILMQHGLDNNMAQLIAKKHTKEVSNDYAGKLQQKERPIIVITGTASLEGASYASNQRLAKVRAQALYTKMKNDPEYADYRIKTKGVVIGVDGKPVKNSKVGWGLAAKRYEKVVGKKISPRQLENKFYHYNGGKAKRFSAKEKQFAKVAFDQARRVTMKLVIPKETFVAMNHLKDNNNHQAPTLLASN